MRGLAASILMTLLLPAAAGVAQTTIGEAREEGNAFGKAMRGDSALVPGDAQVAEVPGYAGTTLPEAVYFDNPDRMAAEGGARAGANEAFLTVTDQQRTRPSFSNDEILETTRRGMAIEQDPHAYAGGEALTGAAGTCTELPPSADTKGYYEATCNQGHQVGAETQTCSGHYDASAYTINTRFWYYGAPASHTRYGFALNSVMEARVRAGTCQFDPALVMPMCDAQAELGMAGPNRDEWVRLCKQDRNRNRNVNIFSCTVEVPPAEIPEHRNVATGTAYARAEGTTHVTVTRNEGTCPAMLADPSCTPVDFEVCTAPNETRIIEGVPVTEDCWSWTRSFTCQRVTPASDCSQLEEKPECRFLRDECLDDPQAGACRDIQRIYSCPLPSANIPADKQYVCAGDVFCINGECETIEREASTEFKDALVALHAIGDAGKQFDPDALTVFSGERETCSKKIFGAANCCSGKGVPLITPALCSAAERKLDEKDDKGLCHRVGSYCSASVLGVCTTSRDAYCCFGSKLSRILQVQGRTQIGKPWDKPKNEQCRGFTIEEFQRLDLSLMDFAEVYAEFMEAAKLPDEVGVMTDIQQKIQGYYDLHGGK